MSNGNLHDLFPLSVIILSFLRFRQFEQLLSWTTSGSFHSVRNLLKQKGLFNHSPGLFSFSCGSFWVGVNTVADQNNWIKAYLKKWSQFGYKQTVVWFVCGMNLICPKLQKNCKFWGKKTAPVASCAVHYGLRMNSKPTASSLSWYKHEWRFGLEQWQNTLPSCFLGRWPYSPTTRWNT